MVPLNIIEQNLQRREVKVVVEELARYSCELEKIDAQRLSAEFNVCQTLMRVWAGKIGQAV